jgi:hypothetical protein
MPKRTRSSVNQLERDLPEGLIVDSAWLSSRGYSTALRSQYLSGGWLHQPARRVYQRRNAPLSWQAVVVSLQTLLGHDLVVGGRTALELQGYGHYLQQNGIRVFLYGPRKPPTWLDNLPLNAAFVFRNDNLLFKTAGTSTAPHTLEPREQTSDGLTVLPWGQYSWPLLVSSPERAILELLNELPDNESFHNADMLMEGLTTLRPRRLQKLLADCKSVKAKRLFYFFADRHKHSWLKHLNKKDVDLGSGKRMLVKGGRLDSKYLITVPRDFDAVQ